MRNLSSALAFITLCVTAPIGSASTDAVAATTVGGAVYQTGYGHGRVTPGPRRPYFGRFPYYRPRHYAPFGGYNVYRGEPRHQRYYGMHGYWSSTWRYPRSLYYHNRMH
jgi:hypothetical protein